MSNNLSAMKSRKKKRELFDTTVLELEKLRRDYSRLWREHAVMKSEYAVMSSGYERLRKENNELRSENQHLRAHQPSGDRSESETTLDETPVVKGEEEEVELSGKLPELRVDREVYTIELRDSCHEVALVESIFNGELL
jgi:hypothetical protein